MLGRVIETELVLSCSAEQPGCRLDVVNGESAPRVVEIDDGGEMRATHHDAARGAGRVQRGLATQPRARRRHDSASRLATRAVSSSWTFSAQPSASNPLSPLVIASRNEAKAVS